ncbi:MAG: DUF1289 domain-containing protein [Alphaproteobacteria bacterium]|jgi:predicted Fe-S protein YdhL (DUF1289 family)|nr:DUF1289 domain-containing protein [Alphaproteobacteria bacterium]
MASFSNVLSPCVGVCQLDPETGYCIGCQRTGDEIMAWPSASDGERREILDRADHRRDSGGETARREHDRRRRTGSAWRTELRHEPQSQ